MSCRRRRKSRWHGADYPWRRAPSAGQPGPVLAHLRLGVEGKARADLLEDLRVSAADRVTAYARLADPHGESPARGARDAAVSSRFATREPRSDSFGVPGA